MDLARSLVLILSSPPPLSHSTLGREGEGKGGVKVLSSRAEGEGEGKGGSMGLALL